MRFGTLAAICSVSVLLAWQSRAGGIAYGHASNALYVAEPCASGRCQQIPTFHGRDKLWKASGRSREIARKLDATGYYKRYSRALKGYPNLRSKTQQEPMRKPRRFNAQNRERYRTHVDRIARTYRLDPKLIDAVIIVESAYEPEAVSSKGAKGLMQLMPDTAKRFDVSDPFNPIANLHGGARYLRLLLDRFDNDVKLALAAYNAGENAVDDYGGKVPPYEETRTYVSRVLKLYAAYGD